MFFRNVFFYFLIGQCLLVAQNSPKDSIASRDLEEGNPFIRNYAPKEYGAFDQNKGVVSDSLGVLYFANGDGVLTYDGVNWKLVALPNKGNVFTVEKDKNGIIYVGGIGEFGYLQPDPQGNLEYKSLLSYLSEAQRNFNSIRKICAIGDKVFFSSWNNILYQWDGTKVSIKSFSTQSQLLPHVIGNSLYVHELGSGLKQLANGKLQLIPNGEFLRDNAIYSMVLFDGDRLLLVASNGVFTYNGTIFKPFEFKNYSFPKDLSFAHCTILADQTIAFSTKRHGIIFTDAQGNVKKHIKGEDLLLSDIVHDLYVDDSGILWAALLKGIAKIEYPSAFSVFDKQKNLGQLVFKTLRYKENLYVATSKGVFTMKSQNLGPGVEFERVSDFSHWTYDMIDCKEGLLIDAPWGVAYWNQDNSYKIEGIPGANALVQSKVDSNRVFVGHFKGLSTLYKVDGIWGKERDIPEVNVHVDKVLEDTNGAIWLKTNENYVIRLSNDSLEETGTLSAPRVTSYGTKEGLPNELSRIRILGGDIYATPGGVIHKFDRSLERFAPDTTDLPKRLGLGNQRIMVKGNDAKGNLQVRLYADDSERYVAWKQTDGSFVLQPTKEHRIADLVKQEAYIDVNDSVLWHSSVESGLIRHDLTKTNLIKRRIPKVIISSVTYKGDSLIYGGWGDYHVHQIPFRQNQFRFKFASPGFYEEEKNEYQYVLEGFDEEWSNWSLETQKDYTNIPEGDYTFKVRTKNIFGEVSGEKHYRFSITSPWYRTGWAYILYGLAGFAFIFLFSKWRYSQLRTKNLALEKVVETRTQEIQLKNRQLSEQTEKLRELDALKTNFFANISHEFRTPLTLIKGPIDRLVQSGNRKLSPSNVKIIQRNTDRLLRLVNQLLDLSKLDSGKLETNPVEGNPMKVLRVISSSFSSLAAQRRIDFTIEIAPKDLWASFDRVKLEQIIYNLLSNAFKFTSVDGKISFIALHKDNVLSVEVQDTGLGIPEATIPFIFNRFYQVNDKDSREVQGTGIGLAVTKEFVELMGGTITVESKTGVGSKFTVTMPLEKIHTDIFENGDLEKPLDEGWGALENRSHKEALTDKKESTVLIVEDNADMRDLMKQDLSKRYNIVEAVNGKDGLALALEESPDLIITDLMMPKMGGMDLCKKLKTNIFTSHVPIIMLTAKAGVENKLRGLETGADDYLTKPFNSEELEVRVKNLIASRKKLRDLFKSDAKIDPKRVTVTSMDEKFVSRLKELLEKNHNDAHFNVPDMQKMLGMGKTRLHRKIKSITNQSPGELLRNFRLKRAAQLIMEGDDDISQIAYSVGFNSLSYFSRRFKDYYGVSPSKFRKD